MKYDVNAPTFVRVLLDGHEVYACQSADNATGEVFAPLVWGDGKAVFDHDVGEYLITKRSGKVELKLVEASAFHSGFDSPVSTRPSSTRRAPEPPERPMSAVATRRP